MKSDSENKHKKTKILVTSALPFVNNVPHLGNLVCVISADVYTKFLRLKKLDVISVLGTDEHGTTSETKALEEGITPKELCDKYSKIHKEIYDWFECDYDCFGRTSSTANSEVTIDIFNKLNKNNYIAENIIEQLYCEKCKRFLADRFVEGQCPKCSYEHARGDQCENCGNLLNATELVSPKCKVCKSKPIIKKSKHLFIDLPKLEPKLRAWMDSVQSSWSDNARTMTQAWMKEGLKQRCITRDLKWGIPVPLKGFEGKVFYSWFDAPIGYIGITKECRKDWKKLWFNRENVKLVQFMGKDNIPFHTILFPAFLIGTDDAYTLMDEISVNEFLNYEGGQFSKSRNVGVFGDDAKNTGISADVFRYYLMVNRPEKQDTEFIWSDFQIKNNAELVAALGNLINRTVVFIHNNFEGKIPEINLELKDKSFLDEVKKIEENIWNLVESLNIKEALKEIMHISRLGNQYLQENEPWKNPDEKRKATSLAVLANLAKDLSILIYPYMPLASMKIRKQLNIELSKDALDWNELGKLSLKAGHKLAPAELLFRKIEDKEIEELREKFIGTKQVRDAKSKFKKPPAIIGNPFDKLQLRVAKIIKVERHPQAEKLYIEQIELGDEQRQIVSGLVPYYTEEELLGKKVVVVTNLHPAKLRGIESNGMLLAAQEGDVVGLLLAEESELGDYVFADEKITEKKIDEIKKLPQIKIDEFAKVNIAVKNGKVFFDEKTLKTKHQKLTVEKVNNGDVR